MTDQVAAKKTLSELAKREDLKNKVCNDCSNPNPQWASLSFAIFICLQCAGTHRGFGVHISFVRSVSMDTWQEDQIKRMQLGGNAPFKDFMKSYEPAEQGGYKDGLGPYDTYHCWAAAQYREKLDAMVAGNNWSPSLPPPSFGANSRTSSPAPGSTQGLRKSRATTRSANNRSDSHSPASLASSLNGTPNLSSDHRARNEEYFANLGKANDGRPADLPPSQGGRYQGFGNTPMPSSNLHPSYGLSSAAAPTMTEIQENPIAALSKGWSLLSAAVVGATKVVSENVIQPGMEKVTDPTFQASVRGYMTEAQKKAAFVGSSANQWSKQQFGVDVADTVGGVVGTVRDKVTGGPTRSGYGQLPASNYSDHDESSALYDGEDDFFNQHSQSFGSSTATTTTHTSASQPKKNDWDDDNWKDF